MALNRRAFTLRGLLGLGGAAAAAPVSPLAEVRREIIEKAIETPVMGVPHSTNINWWSERDPGRLRYIDGTPVPGDKYLVSRFAGGFLVEVRA